MPFEDLSKNELISILELIEQSQRCDSPESVRNLILASREVFEADFAVCGLTTRGLRPVVNHFVNGNYPDEWVRRYTEENLCLHDPVVLHHSRYMLTELWSDVFRQYEYKEARTLVNEAGDYGLKFGISGAVYAPERDEVAIFTFAGDRNRFSKHHKKLLDILTTHFYRALNNSVLTLPEAEKVNRGKGNLGLTHI